MCALLYAWHLTLYLLFHWRSLRLPFKRVRASRTCDYDRGTTGVEFSRPKDCDKRRKKKNSETRGSHRSLSRAININCAIFFSLHFMREFLSNKREENFGERIKIPPFAHIFHSTREIIVPVNISFHLTRNLTNFFYFEQNLCWCSSSFLIHECAFAISLHRWCSPTYSFFNPIIQSFDLIPLESRPSYSSFFYINLKISDITLPSLSNCCNCFLNRIRKRSKRHVEYADTIDQLNNLTDAARSFERFGDRKSRRATVIYYQRFFQRDLSWKMLICIILFRKIFDGFI